MSQFFALEDVLTVYTGRLLCPPHMKGVYTLVKFMLGYPVHTHHLPAALDQCAPELLKQLPQLASVDKSRITPSTAMEILHELKLQFGESLSVSPIQSMETFDPSI